MLSIGTALTPFMTSGFGLVIALGVLAAVGAGAGSFSVLIGAAARRLTEDRRGKAAGIINAGGSLGQFVFAPISQALIQTLGWMGAMWSLALITRTWRWLHSRPSLICRYERRASNRYRCPRKALVAEA